MFSNLTKEEAIILGLSVIALGALIYVYAKKKGAEEAKKEIESLRSLVSSALPLSEKQAAAANQIAAMKAAI